jgi:predicted metal-binding protein
VEKLIAPVRLPFDGALLVCRKCSKKLGKEGKELRKTLKEGARERFGKKGVRVLQTGCFDVCPKGSVTVGATGPKIGLRLVTVAPSARAEGVFEALGLTPTPEP